MIRRAQTAAIRRARTEAFRRAYTAATFPARTAAIYLGNQPPSARFSHLFIWPHSIPRGRLCQEPTGLAGAISSRVSTAAPGHIGAQ